MLDFFGANPLFIICLLVFATGIALFLVARLVRSYPLIFFGVLFTLGSSVMAIMDNRIMLGIYWIVFSAISVIASGLHFYKNIRGAFWWSFGAVAAMILAAVPFEGGELMELLALVIPVAAFFVIGLLGSLIVPRLLHKDKNERKHVTNSDSLVGQRIKISKKAENGRSQRGTLGDVDWAIEPLFPYESFKVGDVVVIQKIKGVTLLCTRDGKDLRDETKQKRRENAEKARIKAQENRAKREAAKATKRIEAEKEKARREEAKAKHEEELRKLKEERAAQKAKEQEELKKVKEDRLAAARARKEEIARQKAEEAAKKAEAEANRKAEEKAKEAKKEEEAPKAEPKKEPVKEAKKEKVVKEQPAELTKEELLYTILSGVILVICIIIIILCCLKALRGIIIYFIFVFFVLALAYLITIFVLEVLKHKEEPKAVEEAKVEEPKVEEPAPVEEPVKKEKAEFVPFAVRMKEADDFLRGAYNELKSEVLSYGIKSRVSSTSDRFRLHKKEYVKMVIAGQFLKLYFALNPEDYKDTTYPFDDAGRMGAHKDTPFVFKIKSGLSIRRAKQLINDVASKGGLVQGEVQPHDWASDLENLVEEADEEADE